MVGNIPYSHSDEVMKGSVLLQCESRSIDQYPILYPPPANSSPIHYANLVCFRPGWPFAKKKKLEGRCVYGPAHLVMYDPATNTWSALSPVAQARSFAACCVLPSGCLAVVGQES
jgi:hypothetical protein